LTQKPEADDTKAREIIQKGGKTSAVASARPRKSQSSFTAMSPDDVAALETWIRGATSERWECPDPFRRV
jgi:hypothetical protein